MNFKENDFVSEESEKGLETLITELRMLKGHQIPTSVEQIDGFPIQNYRELQQELESEQIQLLRFAYEHLGDIAQILNPTPLWMVYSVNTICVPLLSLVMAFMYSWLWIILGIAFFFFQLSKTKKLYNDTIFSSAMTNELAFCFLFYSRQISIANSDRTKQYYYSDDGTKST